MKTRLILAASILSITISACNSGSSANGGSNSPITNNSQVVPKTLAAKQLLGMGQLSGGTTGSSANFLAEILSEVFLSNGIFAIPGSIGISFLTDALTTWISGEDDTSTQLAKIDEKLDKVLEGLQTSLSLSSSIISELTTFYKNSMKSEWQNNLKTLETDTGTIDNKFLPYIEHNVFGTVKTTNVDELYQQALANCTDTQILSALDVATSGSTDQNHVDDLAISFFSNYAAESSTYVGAGSVYEALKSSKDSYLTAIFTQNANVDIMQYVNYYNYQNFYYASRLAKGLQELYLMQAAQIAYHYACNVSIEFDNLNLPTGTGESAFNLAIDKLNTIYSPKIDNLEGNLKTYLTMLDNKGLFTYVNNVLFSSATPFLESGSFYTNEADLGKCTLTKLNFTAASNSLAGIAEVAASCISGKSGNILESSTVSFEVPYSTTSSQVTKYGLYQLGYDNAKQDQISTQNASVISSDTIQSIMALKSFTESGDSGYLGYLLAASVYANEPGWNLYFWTSSKITVKTSEIGIYTSHYAENWDSMSDDQEQVMPSKDEMSISSTEIKYNYQEKDKWWAIEDNYSYTDWTLATYHGKLFRIKVDAFHYNEDSYMDEVSGNGAIRRTVSLGCLTTDCNRTIDVANNNGVTLKWTDGTTVNIKDITDHSNFEFCTNLSSTSCALKDNTLRTQQWNSEISGSINKS